jgi:hypothetical protein
MKQRTSERSNSYENLSKFSKIVSQHTLQIPGATWLLCISAMKTVKLTKLIGLVRPQVFSCYRISKCRQL